MPVPAAAPALSSAQIRVSLASAEKALMGAAGEALRLAEQRDQARQVVQGLEVRVAKLQKTVTPQVAKKMADAKASIVRDREELVRLATEIDGLSSLRLIKRAELESQHRALAKDVNERVKAYNAYAAAVKQLQPVKSELQAAQQRLASIERQLAEVEAQRAVHDLAVEEAKRGLPEAVARERAEQAAQRARQEQERLQQLQRDQVGHQPARPRG